MWTHAVSPKAAMLNPLGPVRLNARRNPPVDTVPSHWPSVGAEPNGVRKT